MLPSRTFMKAMVLAAGLGQRMQPLTRGTPKPALPVLGRPMLSQILSGLARSGIREVVVNVHHLPECIAELVSDGSAFGLDRVLVSAEPELLGTGGGLRRAAGFLRGAGPIVVRNADFLSDLDVAALLESHRSQGLPVTLALGPARPGYTEVLVDGAGRVESFGGDGVASREIASRHLFTGAQAIDEQVLDLLPEGPSELIPVLYRKLAAERRIAALPFEGFWWEFGTPESFLEGTLELVRQDGARRAALPCCDPVVPWGDGQVALGKSATIGTGVRLHGPCAIGADSSVGDAAVLERTVILPAARVGRSAHLERCLVGTGACIPDGASFRDAVLAPDDDDVARPLAGGVERRAGLLVREFSNGGRRG